MWLQGAGYTTAFVGVKVLNQYDGDTAALGFDHYAVVESREEGGARYFDPKINLNGVTTKRTGKYSTDEFRAEALRFIRGAAKPYFLMVATAAPHVPALPARRHRGLGDGLQVPRTPSLNEADVSDKPSFIAGIASLTARKVDKLDGIYRRRYESLLAVDEMADALIAEAGPHTCVFYTSDHGYLTGQHRLKGKLYSYEESARVPLVMWGCGAPQGGQLDGIVSNVDLPATLLDLAGVESGRVADGRSLLPLLAGQPWRTALPTTAAWGLHGETEEGDGSSNCVRTAEWMYCSHSNRERELYSLDRDPYQLSNKASAPDRQNEVAALHGLASELRRCSGQSCWFDGDPLKTRRE
jgi:arylsulfatase A-like enzyme